MTHYSVTFQPFLSALLSFAKGLYHVNLEVKIMSDSPPKFLKIGKTSVGLIGLEPALNQALQASYSAPEAADFLIELLGKHNYIAPGSEENYRQALQQEYERRTTGQTHQSDELEVKVFGTGCVSCDQLEGQIFNILAKLGLAADIEKVFELDDIWRHGVLTPPALKINGTLVCQGKRPTPVEIEQWLQEAASNEQKK